MPFGPAVQMTMQPCGSVRRARALNHGGPDVGAAVDGGPPGVGVGVRAVRHRRVGVLVGVAVPSESLSVSR